VARRSPLSRELAAISPSRSAMAGECGGRVERRESSTLIVGSGRISHGACGVLNRAQANMQSEPPDGHDTRPLAWLGWGAGSGSPGGNLPISRGVVVAGIDGGEIGILCK
jgi:hypothetical protein